MCTLRGYRNHDVFYVPEDCLIFSLMKCSIMLQLIWLIFAVCQSIRFGVSNSNLTFVLKITPRLELGDSTDLLC